MNSESAAPMSTNAGAQPEPVAEPDCWVVEAAVPSPVPAAPEPEVPLPESPPPITPRLSQPEPSVEEGVLPSAGVICICGVGSDEPSSCVVGVVVLVVVVVVVVVPPSGTVSPTPTVVPRAQHAPMKRARQSENKTVVWIMRIISQDYISSIVLKRCGA